MEDKVGLIRDIRKWCADNGKDDSLTHAKDIYKMLKGIGIISQMDEIEDMRDTILNLRTALRAFMQEVASGCKNC